MHAGELLAEFRRNQRMSQLDLAVMADVSSRHLSFIETGRSQPSAGMLKRLARELGLSCRDTNRLLHAAGYAPAFSESSLNSEAMAPVRQALEIMLASHDPYPAIVLDAHWNVLMANRGQQAMVAAMIAERGPLPKTTNVVELVFHPEGYRPFLVNWEKVASFLVRRLRRDLQARHDPVLDQLMSRLSELADIDELLKKDASMGQAEPMLALEIELGGQRLRSFSTLASFGTALDVVMEELRIEHYFPADDATRQFFMG